METAWLMNSVNGRKGALWVPAVPLWDAVKRLDLFPPVEPRAARKKHGAGRSSAKGLP